MNINTKFTSWLIHVTSRLLSTLICFFSGCMEEWTTAVSEAESASLKWLTVNPTYGSIDVTTPTTTSYMRNVTWTSHQAATVGSFHWLSGGEHVVNVRMMGRVEHWTEVKLQATPTVKDCCRHGAEDGTSYHQPSLLLLTFNHLSSALPFGLCDGWEATRWQRSRICQV